MTACPGVMGSVHGLMICTLAEGHEPPCQWRRKLHGKPCQMCGAKCELDAPKPPSRDAADFASLLEREPPRDPIMGVLEVYAKDDPYCWAIIRASRHEGRLTPELVAELIRHQCERAKSQTARIDKLARMQPPAPIQIDGAAAAMLDLAKKTSDSQASRIKSLEDVLGAIRAKCGEAESYRHSAALQITNHREIAAIINETLDPCKPWCVLADTGRKHEGACVPIEEDDRGD